jgi:hypothetical protein
MFQILKYTVGNLSGFDCNWMLKYNRINIRNIINFLTVSGFHRIEVIQC